jgi:hypothetical protein
LTKWYFGTSWFKDEAILIVPWVFLSYIVACRGVVSGVVAYRSLSLEGGLWVLPYFMGYVFGVCDDIVVCNFEAI